MLSAAVTLAPSSANCSTTCVRACVHACVRACARARMRACVRACVRDSCAPGASVKVQVHRELGYGAQCPIPKLPGNEVPPKKTVSSKIPCWPLPFPSPEVAQPKHSSFLSQCQPARPPPTPAAPASPAAPAAPVPAAAPLAISQLLHISCAPRGGYSPEARAAAGWGGVRSRDRGTRKGDEERVNNNECRVYVCGVGVA